jgi:hypothetical protein
MLFVVIERFKNREAKPIYQRLKEQGRMMPDAVKYLGSWIEENFDRCFQVMECNDVSELEEWASHWRDLMDFEFIPVRTSKEVVEMMLAA